MCGAIPPLPQYAFMACCAVKKQYRDKFTFTLLLYIYALHSRLSSFCVSMHYPLEKSLNVDFNVSLHNKPVCSKKKYMCVCKQTSHRVQWQALVITVMNLQVA
jgi:hypothetical protein